ncbi:hypothetical protein KQH51_05470 [bacterium]|nr:hypothetical protein [bacterium]MCB2202365.1 hypothetical protein [bacterium]
MMKLSNLPSDLIFPDSLLRLYFEATSEVNRTGSALVFEGTRGGFLSLSNALIYFRNDLEESVSLHELSFVNSEIEMTMQIASGASFGLGGEVERLSEHRFVWRLSEEGFSEFAFAVHSLGHLNPEIHFDDGVERDQISVYCVVDLFANGGARSEKNP